MGFVGVLVAMLAGFLIWTRWLPDVMNSGSPKAYPRHTNLTHSIDRVTNATSQYDALQKRRVHQFNQQE